jgi:DNA-binding transcriptional LysR family regulator
MAGVPMVSSSHQKETKMDLWRLKIFRRVIEHNSFSKAAEGLNLSQPTVSSHIKDLEHHFEVKLIDRLDKKAVPTKAGELLYYYAGRLATLYDETEAAMSEFHGKIKGRLIIGGSTIPAGYILPRLIGGFMQTYPEVRISLIVGDTKKILDDILSNTLEIGVVGARSHDQRLIQKELINEEMLVIVPGDHKWAGKTSIDIKALTIEPFIIREAGSGTWISIQKKLADQGLGSKDLNIVAELGSTEAVVQGIKSHIGISILSPVAVAEDLSAGTLNALKIDGVNLERQFYLTQSKNRSESPLGKAFREFIEKQIRFSQS